MRKLYVLICFIGIISQAQVGINTTNPKATLDIQGDNRQTVGNGLLVPRLFPVEADQMKGDIEESTLIYEVI